MPRRGLIKNSLWTVLTPAGLRHAACPNSAAGIVCEPLIGSSPGSFVGKSCEFLAGLAIDFVMVPRRPCLVRDRSYLSIARMQVIFFKRHIRSVLS